MNKLFAAAVLAAAVLADRINPAQIKSNIAAPAKLELVAAPADKTVFYNDDDYYYDSWYYDSYHHWENQGAAEASDKYWDSWYYDSWYYDSLYWANEGASAPADKYHYDTHYDSWYYDYYYY